MACTFQATTGGKFAPTIGLGDVDMDINVLDLYDERRDSKKKLYEAKEYREANQRIQKAVKKTKGDWIGSQYEEIETCLN